MKKIGIFGGTFNPIHNAHLEVAKCALYELNLDNVVFVPTFKPYHKNDVNVSYEHRLNMIKIALKNYSSKFLISELEKDLQLEKSYTFDLLKNIKKMYKIDDIFFILGFDALLDIEKWNNFTEIFKVCSIIVFDRENKLFNIEKYTKYLQRRYNADIKIIKNFYMNISSSDIRANIKNRNNYSNLPSGVKDYIINNRLYEN